MNIDELVTKYSRLRAASVYTCHAAIRGALTEQAEAFKGELQSYDGMVRELTKTVEDMQAAQSVPVVGEPVAWVIVFEDTEVRNEVFIGEGAEAAARHRHKQVLLCWNCHLLTTAPTNSIPAAELATLREKAETHALELRAYEATVQNLEQRIRQIEAQRVPEKVECGCGDIYPASQFMCANCLAAVGAADELRRVDEAQSVPVVGEPVAWVAYTSEGGFRGITLDVKEADRLAALGFYVNPLVHISKDCIPAAELATLREKAAMADELRKDAERLQFMIDATAILMYSVGIDRTLCRVEWPLTGYVQDAFYLSERAAIDAAIAKENGK